MSIRNVSPVSQDYIWLAEYFTGETLAGFDLTTKRENSFYNIDKEKLSRFGLIGHNNKLFFEVNSGTFNVFKQVFDFVYEVGDKKYQLTQRPFDRYSDIISYKDAEMIFNPMDTQGRSVNRITQFNFGYKIDLEIKDIKFNFKPLFKLPYNQKPYFYFWLVADKDLDGAFVVYRNGKEVDRIKAPLKAGVGGEIQRWQLK